MLLGYNIVANRKAEARAFAGRLRGEERLKELVFDLRWNANAVVADVDFNRLAQIACRHLQGRLELRVAPLLLAFGSSIESIAEQVETDAGDVLGDEFDRSYGLGEIFFQRDVDVARPQPHHLARPQSATIGECQHRSR